MKRLLRYAIKNGADIITNATLVTYHEFFPSLTYIFNGQLLCLTFMKQGRRLLLQCIEYLSIHCAPSLTAMEILYCMSFNEVNTDSVLIEF